MAKMVLLASFLSVASNNLHPYLNKVEATAEIEAQDVTVFTSGGWKEVIGGLGSGTLALSVKNDVAAAAIDSIMWPLFIARTPIAFEVRADQAAVGASNPKYTGLVLLTSWVPVSGNVGDVNAFDVTYPTSGPVTRAIV